MKKLYAIILLLNITLLSIMFALFILLLNLPTEQVDIINDTPVTNFPIEEEKLNAKTNENVTKEKDNNKYVSIEVCNSSSVKTYMDYRMITSKSSKQYRYIQEHITVTDGFLWEDEYIGVACKQLGRNFIGIELDETYFNIAKERIENTTTQEALFDLDKVERVVE